MIGAAGLIAGRLGSAAFNPATLPLTGWMRASYSASPWSGVASAGSSGSRSFSEATNPPSAGPALNAFTPADFDGSNDMLEQSTGTADDYVNAGAGTIAALVRLGSISGGSSTPYLNQAVIADAGGFAGLAVGGLANNKWIAFVNDGAYQKAEVAASASSWAFLFMTWDGSNLRLSLDGGAPVTVACGNLVDLSTAFRMGRGYSANFLHGRIAEVMIADSALSLANRNSIRGYLNARYGVSV